MLQVKTQKPKKNYSITQVVEKHLQSLLHDTSITLKVFVTNLREHYEQSHFEQSQFIDWSYFHELDTRMQRDAQKFGRWLEKKDANLDLYDSVVMAFPSDRRFSLQVELFGRQGMYPVPIPTLNVVELASFGNIAKKTGQTMIVVAKLYEDGVIDKNDIATAPEALSTIDEAIAALLAMKNTINVNVYGEKA